MTHVRSHVWKFRTICGAPARLDERGNVVHRNGEEIAEAEADADCFTCKRVIEAITNAVQTKEEGS